MAKARIEAWDDVHGYVQPRIYLDPEPGDGEEVVHESHVYMLEKWFEHFIEDAIDAEDN